MNSSLDPHTLSLLYSVTIYPLPINVCVAYWSVVFLSHQSLYRWLLAVMFDVISKSCAKSNENYYTELINQCRSDKWMSLTFNALYMCVCVECTQFIQLVSVGNILANTYRETHFTAVISSYVIEIIQQCVHIDITNLICYGTALFIPQSIRN